MNIHDINFLPQKVLLTPRKQPLMRRPRLEFPSFSSVFIRVLMGPTLNQMRIHTLFLPDPFHITLSSLSRSPKRSPPLRFPYQIFVRTSQLANELSYSETMTPKYLLTSTNYGTALHRRILWDCKHCSTLLQQIFLRLHTHKTSRKT
jgi:hypothetical protein